MKVLITGALGALGHPLVKELRGRGHEVWMCDLPHHDDPQYIRADVGQHRQIAAVFAKGTFDLVYHLAAEFGRWNGEDHYETLWQTNAIGTKNMIRLQEQHRFRMVFTSSSEVYGDFEGTMSEQVMDQTEVRQLNDYAMSKWVNELQIINSAAQHATETVRVRLFNVYGPGERFSPYRSVVVRFAYSAIMGLPYTVHGGHTRSLLYIDDLTRSMANIAERFHPGAVYNLGAEEQVAIRDLSDRILALAGRDDSLVSYAAEEPFTTRHKRLDTAKARREIGHAPSTPLDVGLAHTIAWLRAEYR